MKKYPADLKSYKLSAKILSAAFALIVEQALISFMLLCIWSMSFICLWLIGYSSRETTILFWGGFVILFFIGTGKFSFPSETKVIERLEKESALLHRPLLSLHDHAVTKGREDFWTLEKDRQKNLLSRLKYAKPKFDLSSRDPYALRIFFVLFVFCAIFMAPQSWTQKIKNGLLLPVAETASVTEQNFTQIRITPPAYTGQKPILLSRPTRDPLELLPGTTILAEIKSKWGQPTLKVGSHKILFNRKKDTDLWTIETPLEKTDRIKISVLGFPLFSQSILWTEDKPASIAWKGEINILPTGELKLPLEIEDDYGIQKLTLHGILVPGESKPPFGSPLLIEKKMTLSLRNSKADVTPVFDATGHFWVGKKVSIMIEAEDYAGNISATTPINIVLPQRVFQNPVAAQLASIRSGIVGMQTSIDDLITSSEYILFRPDLYKWDSMMILGLRSVASRLAYTQDSKDMESVANLLWSLAMKMEDGRITETQTSLREALDNLQQAIQKGADKSEISRLMQEMQKALVKHLQNIAKQVMKQSPQQNQQPQNQMNVSGLNEFLEQLQQEIQNGDTKSAMQKLNALQQLTDMLGSSAAQGMPKDAQEMMHNAQALQEIIGRQKKLMDLTRQNEAKDLSSQAKEQKEIGQATDELKTKAPKNSEKLSEASGEMSKSKEALESNDGDTSLAAQKNALDKLQDANKSMQEQIKKRMQNMMGISLGGPSGSQDPLGRSRKLNDDNTEIPGNARQKKSDQIIKTLREREGDMKRSVEERNYYQRLLKQW